DKFNVPEYAREAVALCLERGIIKDSDVSAYSANPYVRKQEICRYLGLAFGVTVDSSAPVLLPFRDSMFIASQYKAYVSYLVEIGVISETNDNFNPNEYITRETYAKMLDIASSAYEKKMNGADTTLPDNEDTDIIWTDSPDTPDESEDTVSNPVIIEDDGVQADVTAYVDQVIPEYGSLAVFVGTERRVYKIAEDAKCTIDGVSEGFWKLEKSDLVKLYTEGSKVTKIVGESKIRKTIGKLVGIQSGDKTLLTMQTSSGENRSYTITAKTIVIKDGKSALWQELKAGNDLVITTSYNELIEINADGIKSTDKGVIESLVYSRIAPLKFVITALDGSQNEYYAEDDMEITGAGEDVYSLRPGMQVEVSLIDDEISKIAVINETAQVLTELKGLIKSIDLEARLMVVEVYDSSTNKYVDKKVYTTDETKIADVDFNFLGFNSLKVNQIISVRGTGTVDGVYAKTIQVAN
ncbi:MAG: S-layer homology domain-containing protein, partial [Clostridiaceae bacterium]|nr:S-layer homology domain-containing protein [Clostridiaceae bacterium]